MSFYDHFANRKRNKYGQKIKISFAEKIFNLSKDSLSELNRVLELGPGDGYIAHLSKKNNCNYLGLEGSRSVSSKLLSEGYDIIQTFVPPLPENIGVFDLCFALHIIEHLSSINKAGELINQVGKHLNEKGKIIIATPDYLRWRKDFFNCDYTHSLPFTMKNLNQLLINNGFKIVYADYYVGNIFGIKLLPLYWIAKLFYSRLIDNAMKNSLKSDIWYRGYLTFLPNIIVIAQKK